MTLSKLHIVILAAGQGTRMKSSKPKVLHEIAGLPLLSHVIKTAEKLNPESIRVVLAPHMDEVAKVVAPHQVAIQQKAMGTGDALRAAIEGQDLVGDILVLYGDVPLVSHATLAEFVEHHRAGAFAATVLAFAPPDPKGYGRIFQNGDGTLARIVEEADATPEERLVRLSNSGLMCLQAGGLNKVLKNLSPANAQGEYYLVDVPKALNDSGRRCGVIRGEFAELRGINDRAQLAEMEMFFQHRKRIETMLSGVTMQDPNTVYFHYDTEIAQDVTIGANVVFGAGVKVESGVTIKPFSHIEGAHLRKDSAVGPFVRLRAKTEIGEGAHVGNFVEVKNTKLEAGVKAGHLSYLGDAEIGAGSNIGAGTITCNYDGFEKHKTVIGRNVFIGSHTTLVAPVSLGDGSFTAASSVVTEDVEQDALAISRSKQESRSGWAATYRAAKETKRK